MKLLVGIPTFRRPAMLAALLRSLERQDGLDAIELEIFVADNDPHAAEGRALCDTLRAQYPWPLAAAVVEERGISAARNRILDEAARRRADWIAMIDDDETASPGWLAALVSARERFAAQVVGGAVSFRFDRPVPASFASSGAFAPKRGISGPIAMLNASSNVLLDCTALARLGWPRFDPRFGLTGGEDKEYFTRLKQAGLGFAWADDALVFETIPIERTRTRSIVRRAYGIGNSDYRIAALHSAGGKRVHLAKSVAVLAGAAALAPVLLLPRYRLWLLRRSARAMGRLGAALGISRAHYGGTISP